MSQATNFLEAALLDHLFGISAYSAPATMYLALFTAMPSGETPTATEVTGGSYARKAITNDATEWSRTGNVITNDNLLDFVTASANWGTVTHWALMDASSGGNMLVYGELSTPVAINNGSTFRVAAGQLSITYNAKSNYAAGKLLDHLFGIASWTVPANQYIALFTAAPTDAGGGTEVSTSGTAYARETVANSASGWSRTNNEVTNDNNIEWAEATASYGTVVAVGSFDALTVGNMLWWATKTPSETVGLGSIFAFAAGALAYTLD
jgi:hypothetical protein